MAAETSGKRLLATRGRSGDPSWQSILQKKDTSVTFWAERIFLCHTYDTSMTLIVTKPGIIIDVVGS